MSLVTGTADIENGLGLTVDLRGEAGSHLVGWRAKRHTGLIDIDLRESYDPLDFWDPVMADRSGSIILDPGRPDRLRDRG